jgi:hypothetical protein
VVSPRNAALAGMIGPAVFALVAVLLTFAQYGFMRDLGWDPLGASDVPWPSGLALGPLGWLQAANFAFFGLTLIVFALGLDRAVASGGRVTWAGPALMVVSGVSLMLAAFATDPRPMVELQTWHGAIHLLAFVFLVLSFLPSLFFWWRRSRRDPRWRGYAKYTLITALLYIVLLPASIWQWGFYLFLATLLAWIEVMAIHLRSVVNASTPRVR